MTIVEWFLGAAVLTFLCLFVVPLMFFLCARMVVLGAWRGRMYARREQRENKYREGGGYES